MRDFEYIIKNCPSCDSLLTWKGVDLICISPECLESNSKRIAYFFKTLGSDFITERTIENLGVKSIEEMYNLDELNIMNIEGFGLSRGEQIVNEVQKTLNTTPEKLLAAFSIPSVGIEVATKIMSKINQLDELFIFELPVNMFEDVVGPKTSEKFCKNIYKFKGLYEFLVSKGLKFKEKVMGDYSGKMFALTGAGPLKRDQIIKMIQAKGGSVNTVSKDTDYLVAEDPEGNSGKLQKARKYGTKVIGYDELLRMLE